MLNVKTMELLPHSPAYFSMNQIPHKWKEIKELSENGKPNYPHSNYFLGTSLHAQDIMTIFQYMGLCMTHNMNYQIFLLLLGEGANGKSILINLFNAVIGRENISSLSMQNLTQRFFSAQLAFKLCNTCADISKVSIEDDAELKKIVGGDTLQAEFKGKDSFSFVPYAKLFLVLTDFHMLTTAPMGLKGG